MKIGKGLQKSSGEVPDDFFAEQYVQFLRGEAVPSLNKISCQVLILLFAKKSRLSPKDDAALHVIRENLKKMTVLLKAFLDRAIIFAIFGPLNLHHQ